ncbi:MAG: CD225/dispanin family protein [Tannerella sp.]|jgi:hypothetical protein|nr:CD225/dispanin family protein [Tannerella sp.]
MEYNDLSVYLNAIDEVKKAEKKYAAKSQLQEHYFVSFVNTAINGNMSVGRKCNVLELLNTKLRTLFGSDDKSYFKFILDALEACFNRLKQLDEADSAWASDSSFSEFTADVDNRTFKDFNHYLLEIFSLSGLFYSPNGSFTVEEDTLLQYNLPSFTLTDTSLQSQGDKKVRRYSESRPTNYMGLAVIAILICFPVGLVAAFFASRVKPRFNSGKVSKAYKASQYAKYLALATIGILLLYILYETGFK